MQASDYKNLAATLAPLLEPLQADIQKLHYPVVPSAFTGTDPHLRALPLPTQWRWSSLEQHVKRFEPKTVVLQLPPFWQLEPFVYLATHAAEAAICIIEPQNYPLDKAAMRFAATNAVIAEAAEAAAIAAHLSDGHIELPPYWVLLHAADAPAWDVSSLLKNRNLEVAQEVHLAPGVPLLVQCEHIVAAHTDHYHQSCLFVWNADLQAPTITTSGSMPFTLKNFALPFTLEDKGICACGKQLLERVL